MTPLLLYAVAAALACIAISVFRAKPRSPVNRWFAATVVASAAWAFGVAISHAGLCGEAALRLTFAAASMIPCTFLTFTLVYPRASFRPPRFIVALMLLVGLSFALLSLATPWIAYDLTVGPWGIRRRTGPLYSAFAVYLIGSFALALALMVRKWRNARGIDRIQLKYLTIGLLVAGAGGIAANLIGPLLTGNSNIAWLGPFFNLVLVILASHSVIRHRLMDVRVVVHKGLTIAIATALSLLPVVIALTVFWPRLSTHLESSELVVLVTSVAIVALSIPLTRDVAGKVLDRYVYRSHVNYQRTVREASRVLTRILDLPTLLSFVSHVVETSTEAEGVSIYLERAGRFSRAVDVLGHGKSTFKRSQDVPSSVIAAVADATGPLVLDEVSRDQSNQGNRRLREDLARLNWAVVLPVLAENKLLALIVVGPKLSGDPFYPRDFDLIMTLANQAGIAIKNAQLYAEVVLANEYIENIVATIESGVIGINPSRQITIFNRAAEQLTGLKREDVRMQAVDVLPACLAEVLKATVADGEPRVQPEVSLAAGATIRPVICTTSPLRDQAGATVGAVAVFSDLTPFKELETERGRAERLRYLEVLAAGIAHEIKNPLVAIKTFAQLIPRRHSDDRFVDDFSRVVTREIGRMEQLVDRLRTLSRPAERPRLLVDLRRPLADAVEFLTQVFADKRVGLALHVADTPYVVWGEPNELEQLFLNLLINAHEATPPGGQVSVEIAAGAEQITVMVADTGPGIPADVLDRVFEPFFTTKQRGSGLGLAICSRIATAHGAKLRAKNHAQGGAVCTVEFVVPKAAEVPIGA